MRFWCKQNSPKLLKKPVLYVNENALLPQRDHFNKWKCGQDKWDQPSQYCSALKDTMVKT
jgi:hypothetical protein